MIKLLTATLLAIALAGCSTLGDGDTRNDLAAAIAIKYATLKVIEQADEPTAKASRVIDIASQARQMVDSGTVTLIPALELAVRERIDWQDLSPADTLLADALITAVRMELEARVEGGSLSGESVLALAVVLDNIVEAARLYAAG